MIKALIFLSITLLIFTIYSFLKKLQKSGVILSFIILFVIFSIMLSAFFFFLNDRSKKNYFPPKYDGEKVIPGYFNEKD